MQYYIPIYFMPCLYGASLTNLLKVSKFTNKALKFIAGAQLNDSVDPIY